MRAKAEIRPGRFQTFAEASKVVAISNRNRSNHHQQEEKKHQLEGTYFFETSRQLQAENAEAYEYYYLGATE